MFTGIVQAQGRVVDLQPRDAGAQLTVARGDLAGTINLGDSVCVSGVCLTAVSIDGDQLRFDVVRETLERTTLSALRADSAVNLELAVTPSQPLGGHFLQGHVDGVGEVTAIHHEQGAWRVTVRPPSMLMDCTAPKGSIAIDGVSLTIASVESDGRFEVALIPETLNRTTLNTLEPGQPVNLEGDMIAKTVVHCLTRMASRARLDQQPITLRSLQDAGFLAKL